MDTGRVECAVIGIPQHRHRHVIGTQKYKALGLRTVENINSRSRRLSHGCVDRSRRRPCGRESLHHSGISGTAQRLLRRQCLRGQSRRKKRYGHINPKSFHGHVDFSVSLIKKRNGATPDGKPHPQYVAKLQQIGDIGNRLNKKSLKKSGRHFSTAHFPSEIRLYSTGVTFRNCGTYSSQSLSMRAARALRVCL